jgi:cell wall-associated NlpC family hydrolase
LQQGEVSVEAGVSIARARLAVTRRRLRAQALAAYMGDVIAIHTNALFSPTTQILTKEYEQIAIGDTSAALAAFGRQSANLSREVKRLETTSAQIQTTLALITEVRRRAMATASAQQAALAAFSVGNDAQTPLYVAAQAAGRNQLVLDRDVPSLPPAVIAAMWAAGSQVGVPYVWGGETPLPSTAAGFDCSGLVQWSYRQAGIALPRTAQQQHDAVTAVPADQAQPGDLAFWNDGTTSVQHVAIYVGAGVVLQAPSTGSVVSFAPLWADGLVGFGRVTVPAS